MICLFLKFVGNTDGMGSPCYLFGYLISLG